MRAVARPRGGRATGLSFGAIPPGRCAVPRTAHLSGGPLPASDTTIRDTTNGRLNASITLRRANAPAISSELPADLDPVNPRLTDDVGRHAKAAAGVARIDQITPVEQVAREAADRITPTR